MHSCLFGVFLLPTFEQKLTKKAGTLCFEKNGKILIHLCVKNIPLKRAGVYFGWLLKISLWRQTKWLRIMKSVPIAKKIIEIAVRTPQGECTPLFLGLPFPIFYSRMAAAPIPWVI